LNDATTHPRACRLRASYLGLLAPTPLGSTLKRVLGDTVNYRRNEGENFCEADLKALGLIPSKRGWPDFLAWNKDGTLAFVAEVKAEPDAVLKIEQIRVMAALAKAGIAVKRYDPVSGFSDFDEASEIHRRRRCPKEQRRFRRQDRKLKQRLINRVGNFDAHQNHPYRRLGS